MTWFQLRRRFWAIVFVTAVLGTLVLGFIGNHFERTAMKPCEANWSGRYVADLSYRTVQLFILATCA